MSARVAAHRSKISLLRRVIVWVIVASFGLAAVGGITVLLGGESGRTAYKVLSTTAIVGAFSVAILCCASLIGKRLQVFGLAGGGADVDDERVQRLWGIFGILAALGAIVVPVMSLLLPDPRPRTGEVPADLLHRLTAEADRRGMTVEELIAPVLAPAHAPAVTGDRPA